MNVLMERLKTKNIKITPQRLAVYNILCNTTSHPSADSVYKALKPEWPTLSLATVYKTLETLTEAGLVAEISACRESMRYDANTDPHGHLICLKCGEVNDYSAFEFSIDEMNQINTKNNYKVEYKVVTYFGICGNCTRGETDVC